MIFIFYNIFDITLVSFYFNNAHGLYKVSFFIFWGWGWYRSTHHLSPLYLYTPRPCINETDRRKGLKLVLIGDRCHDVNKGRVNVCDTGHTRSDLILNRNFSSIVEDRFKCDLTSVAVTQYPCHVADTTNNNTTLLSTQI